MGLVRTGETAYDKELRKWEEIGQEGTRPMRRYVPFPRMVFKATKVQGVIERAVELDKLVHSEAEYDLALEDGYGSDPNEAVAKMKAWDEAIADAAAHRAYTDRNMSARAQAEAQAAEDATAEHVAEVPRTPIKRKGWPKGKPRAKAASAQSEA